MKVRITSENTIETNLYTKPTDSHDYVLYNSAHPQRCKDSIPYSQFLRIRRICSNIDDFDTNVVMLGRHFLKRGYPIELLEEAALLARRKDRMLLLHPDIPLHNKEEENQNKVFLITTYNPNDSIL